MSKADRPIADDYYREARSWVDSREQALRGSRRIAWIVAGVATAAALMEAAALMLLAPLKTVVPYTLLVDRQTGYVQALDPTDPANVTPDAALTQSFLAQYVIAREGFDITDLKQQYRKVGLWSAGAARSGYAAAMRATNPESPLAQLPRDTVVQVRVKSVSPLGQRGALVRFETRRRDAGGSAAAPRDWVAIIRYRFSGAAMALSDRFVNPLGFQVMSYRRDAEAVEPEPAPAPAPVQDAALAPRGPVGAPGGTQGRVSATLTPSRLAPGHGGTRPSRFQPAPSSYAMPTGMDDRSMPRGSPVSEPVNSR